MNTKNFSRLARRKRIKAKLLKSSDLPRLVVYRSLKYIYGQLMNDQDHIVIASSSDLSEKMKGTKSERAYEIGKVLGEKILAKKIQRIAFDRNGYRYHGRVKALASGLRDAGLTF
ncbi:MAG: 50S ribosomal protein L18 [Candidatus Abawacabacteria bacterium]|nr:50S ribosomal protein L18 [Candidatus Abawacabacteria bacterium]